LIEKPRTADWVVSEAGPLKKMIPKIYGPSVKIKKKLIESAIAKN
jgi:hypothetical protein